MALLLRRAINDLRDAVLAMPLARYAKQAERTDAADGDGPRIPGAAAVIDRAKTAAANASEFLAARVVRHSKSEFKRLGVSLNDGEPEFAEAIDTWRAANIARVGTLLEFERDELSDILSKGFGKTVAELRQDIEERLEVATRKAELLARDQVLKLNSQISHGRMKAAGIEEGYWTTSHDERVRDSHAQVDGELFNIEEGLEVDDEMVRPGEPPLCRCITVPRLPELDDEEADDS